MDVFEKLRKVDETILKIQKELKGSFVSQKVLIELANQLQEIEDIIDATNDPEQGPFLKSEIEKHQDTLIHLFGRWHTLFVDAEVTGLAEQAQELMEETQEGSKKAMQDKLHDLNDEIQALCLNQALSVENQLMITLARRFIAKAFSLLSGDKAGLEKARAPLEEVDAHEAGLLLFEIAKEIYDGSIKDGVNRFHLLSQHIKAIALRHFQHLGGEMIAFEHDDLGAINRNAFTLIQSLLVTIQELVQGMHDGSYPDRETVDDVLSNTDSMM